MAILHAVFRALFMAVGGGCPTSGAYPASRYRQDSVANSLRRSQSRGRMEGHASMNMSVHEGTIWQRMFSDQGRTAISHFFVMDSVSLWLDIGGGLLIAGALAAWVGWSFLLSHSASVHGMFSEDDPIPPASTFGGT
jgi:hypothetical protein